jgi:hypothetical protein
MIAPLALLQDNNPISEDKLEVKTTSALRNQTSEYSNNSETFGLDSTSGFLTATPPTDPEVPDSNTMPEEPHPSLAVTSGDSVTDLSPVILITVPGFLIALGVFVYLRRQV